MDPLSEYRGGRSGMYNLRGVQQNQHTKTLRTSASGKVSNKGVGRAHNVPTRAGSELQQSSTLRAYSSSPASMHSLARAGHASETGSAVGHGYEGTRDTRMAMTEIVRQRSRSRAGGRELPPPTIMPEQEQEYRAPDAVLDSDSTRPSTNSPGRTASVLMSSSFLASLSELAHTRGEENKSAGFLAAHRDLWSDSDVDSDSEDDDDDNHGDPDGIVSGPSGADGTADAGVTSHPAFGPVSSQSSASRYPPSGAPAIAAAGPAPLLPKSAAALASSTANATLRPQSGHFAFSPSRNQPPHQPPTPHLSQAEYPDGEDVAERERGERGERGERTRDGRRGEQRDSRQDYQQYQQQKMQHRQAREDKREDKREDVPEARPTSVPASAGRRRKPRPSEAASKPGGAGAKDTQMPDILSRPTTGDMLAASPPVSMAHLSIHEDEGDFDESVHPDNVQLRERESSPGWSQAASKEQRSGGGGRTIKQKAGPSLARRKSPSSVVGGTGGGVANNSKAAKQRNGFSFLDPFTLTMDHDDPKTHEAFMTRVRRIAQSVSQSVRWERNELRKKRQFQGV